MLGCQPDGRIRRAVAFVASTPLHHLKEQTTDGLGVEVGELHITVPVVADAELVHLRQQVGR